jgi:hypothetical protein
MGCAQLRCESLIWRDASHGCECRLAPLPDQPPFLGGLCESNFPCAILLAQRGRLQHLCGHLRFRAVQFNQQESFTDRIVRMDRGFGGFR